MLLGKLLVFIVGAYVSFAHCAEYWVIGPVFGMVVLCWQATNVRAFLSPKRLRFLASSTLIYALVYWISRQKLPEVSYLFSAFLLAVLVGTVLLPLAHGRWLGASRRRVRVAIPVIYGAFYLSQFLNLSSAGQQWINMVSIWQAAYLFCFFGPELRRKR